MIPAIPLILTLLLAAPPTTAPATRASDDDRQMTVSPAAADGVEGSFAYSQSTLQTRDENAATLYFKGILEAPPWFHDVSDYENWHGLHERIARDANVAHADFVLSGELLLLNLCEPAVRRTFADFATPVREQGVNALLPQLNDLRQLATFMGFVAGYRLDRGDATEADEMIRRMFVLGHHVGNARGAVLVEALVGMGIAGLAADKVADAVQKPDATNRYWALTTLPTPMFDLRDHLAVERNFLIYTYPDLDDPRGMTASQFLKAMSGFADGGVPAEQAPRERSATELVKDAGEAVAASAMLSQSLQARGYTPEQLDRVGVVPEAARLIVADYYEAVDGAARYFALPFPQGRPLLARFVKERTEEASAGPAGLLKAFGVTALPSLARIYAVPHRLQREIDALRAVEAIRDHAAEHGGLPQNLADCRLPVPADPMTGRAFGYEVEGRTFRLVAEPYDAGQADTGFVWTVTIRP